MVLRMRGDRQEVLAFTHPTAGRQFVKGTIELGETPLAAALRELREESGVVLETMEPLGVSRIGDQVWHLFAARAGDLPDVWLHRTEDDGGHVFSFFWHPLDGSLDDRWDGIFHQAFACLLSRLPIEDR